MLEVRADGIGVLAFLGDHGNVQVRGGDLHLLQGREIVASRLGERQRANAAADSGNDQRSQHLIELHQNLHG